MKKIFLSFLICISYCNIFSQSMGEKDVISIIPQPVSLTIQKGNFLLKPETAIISADKSAADVASFLSELLHENYGFSVKNIEEKNVSSKPFFSLAINKSPNNSIGNEGYTLKVTPE
ncbi:MAG TPA: glycoside hydrolase family 20 zincin-like fold domain-containing protein, partial [Hanamia sp.]